MLRRLVDHFRPPRIRDRAALRRFVSGEASYLAQRATYEFSRNTLAWYGQHAFADRAQYLGDPDFVKAPIPMLISKDYAAQLRKTINPDKASKSAPTSFVSSCPKPRC